MSPSTAPTSRSGWAKSHKLDPSVREGDTCHLGTHRLEPDCQPCALEAGVPGKEHAAPRPKAVAHGQTFHGALPRRHRS